MQSACLGANVEQCDSSVQDAPEHLVTPGFHLGDALVKLLHLLQRSQLPVLIGGGRGLLAAPGDQRHERRRRRRFLGGSRRGCGGGGGRDGLERGEHGGGRGRRGGQGLDEHPGHLDLGDGGSRGRRRRHCQLRVPGGGARGGREACEVLLGVAVRADGRREARRVTAPERGLGLGGVAPEVDERLPERAVRVGKGEQAVQEAVREGGGGGGGERGAGLREDEELGERGVERVEVGEARGGRGGGGAGVCAGGGGPGADGAGGGVEVREQRVGAAGREADGAHVARLFLGGGGGGGGGGARRAQREGDGAAEGGRHWNWWLLQDGLLALDSGASARCGGEAGEEEGVYIYI